MVLQRATKGANFLAMRLLPDARMRWQALRSCVSVDRILSSIVVSARIFNSTNQILQTS